MVQHDHAQSPATGPVGVCMFTSPFSLGVSLPCATCPIFFISVLVLHSLHRISVGVQSSECIHYYGCFLLRALGS